MLIIFDVDGTLLDGESHDWASFAKAVTHCTGFVPTVEFWQSLEEVTAQAIVHRILDTKSFDDKRRIEQLVQEMHLEGLTEVHRKDPQAFRPATGARELLKHLSTTEGVEIAIATGDWRPTITFKLTAAGFEISSIPIATASDCFSRAEIITLAASRCGRSLENAIYVGDGLWDLRACRKLGIPFIGTGRKIESLREAGARYLTPDLTPPAFMETLGRIGTFAN